MIKKLILIFVIFLQMINANNKENNNMSNILKDKPFYILSVDKSDTEVFVTINGETIYENYLETKDVFEIPTNYLMTSGDNQLVVKVFLTKLKETDVQSKNAYAKVQLKVKTSGVYDKEPIVVSTIEFDNTKENINDKILNTKHKGAYNSSDSFKKINEKNIGEVKISDTTITILDENRTTQPVKGYTISQTINLQTPFPRWKFLDSDDIYHDGNFYNITMDNYYKLLNTPKIQELYKLQDKIYQAVKNKDIDSIIDLFDERSDEMDIAMYKEKGYFKKDLYESLKKDANDERFKLVPFIHKDYYFFISEGKKTVYIDEPIAFNLKKGSGSIIYDMQWRYQNGQWIITR